MVNGVEVGGDGREGILHWNFLVFLGLRMNSLVCERKQNAGIEKKNPSFARCMQTFNQFQFTFHSKDEPLAVILFREIVRERHGAQFVCMGTGLLVRELVCLYGNWLGC